VILFHVPGYGNTPKNMISRLWPRIKRWWHCLLGMFGGHRMQDAYVLLGDPGYLDKSNEIAWIGCECGKAFWWKTDWPPLSDEEKDILKQSGFRL